MKLSCCIIDDEPLALALIENYVSKTPFLQLTGKFSSAIAASTTIQTNPPDILYLDIQMAELNGMEFARAVPDKTRIIFTTAFQQYALESYKVNALDYLLKPFSYAEFLATANKALQWYLLHEKAKKPDNTDEQECIYVKVDYRLMQIKLNNILYVEGQKDYLKIFLEGENLPIITHMTLKNMEELLPAKNFIRVHRSFIVQKNKIRIIERNRIVFNKTYIPVSDSYKEAFQVFIEGKMA
jgi:DNA-binding LytR/AlgR family response regulator